MDDACALMGLLNDLGKLRVGLQFVAVNGVVTPGANALPRAFPVRTNGIVTSRRGGGGPALVPWGVRHTESFVAAAQRAA